VPRCITGETSGLRPAFSPTDDVLACGSDRDILLVSTTTGEIMGRLSGHTGRVTCLAFNRGKYLFSGAQDGE
jgi:WD40 repeat protein